MNGAAPPESRGSGRIRGPLDFPLAGGEILDRGLPSDPAFPPPGARRHRLSPPFPTPSLTRTTTRPRPSRRSRLWADALDRLRARIPEREFRTWIEPARWLGDEGGEARLQVPNPVFAAHLEGRYENAILEALHQAGSDAVAVLCLVRRNRKSEPPADGPEHPRASTRSEPLSPDFTFETFVTGARNRCAREAALAVSDPGAVNTPFTPLLVYGGIGVGKTHLLQSIAWRLRKGGSESRVLYTRGESFGRQVVRAVRTHQLYPFREACQRLEALVVDDLEFLAGLDRFSRSAEEFFHAVTGLAERGAPVVISATSHPQDIENLDPRIRSRLESGLVTDIGLPDRATRVRILELKAARRAVVLPDGAAEKVADRLREGPRDLESALSRIVTLARAERASSISMDLVERVLEKAPPPAVRQTGLPEVIGAIATAFGVPPVRLVGRYRGHEVSLARHVGMYVAREVTGRTLSEIGRAFRRKHSTILYGINRVKRQRARDPGLDRLVERLIRRLR